MSDWRFWRKVKEAIRDNSEESLRGRARAYARILRPGSTIIEATDGEYIAAWRHLLPAALAELHLEAIALEDGTGFVIARTGEAWEDEVTQEAPVLQRPRQHTVCGFCQGDIFTCEHQAQWNFPGSDRLRPMAFRAWGRA